MPGSYQRDPLRERSGPEWWEHTGRAAVAMADAHLARLRVSA